jgi:signal transduction histidine kinase
MLPIQRETHWVYKTAQITRIIWFVFHLLFLVIYLADVSYSWLLLPIFFAAFLIPQWSGTKSEHFAVKNYPYLELLFSGLFLVFGCYLLGEFSSFFAYPALCAGIYSRDGKERWILWAGFSIVPLLAFLAIGLDQLGLGIIEGLFFFAIGMAVAKVLEAEKKTQLLLEENQRQNQLLEEYAKQIEKVTLLEERDRLARDLHDTIGHTYTSVIMGLDAAAFLMENSPTKAKEQVERLSSVMRESLGDIRSHIHQISSNDEKEELVSQLRHIAEEFALHTKTEINFQHDTRDTLNISTQGTIALIRCLQESLTNAIRHGHANFIKIMVMQEDEKVSLIIQDHGAGMSEIKHGFGLNGMKERLESLQGGMTIESKVNIGTVVTCFLPIKANQLKGELIQDDKSVNCG